MNQQQISIYWSDIKDALIYSVPPLAEASDEGLNEILQSMLTEQMQVWALHEGGSVYAMGITSFLLDPGTKDKNLLIYALCGYDAIPSELWMDGIEALKKYARAKGCRSIVAYTKFEHVKRVSKSLGADTETTFIQWRLE